MSSQRGGFAIRPLPRTPDRLRFALGVGIVTFVCGLLSWLFSTALFDVVTKQTISDVVMIPLALSVPFSCGWVARRSSGRVRLAWSLMCAAGVLWSLGEMGWYYTHYLVSSEQDPSIADVFYLLALLPAAGALVAFPTSRQTGSRRARTVVGSLVVACAVIFVGRAFGAVGGLPPAEGSWLARAVYFAYPIGDVVLACLAAVALVRVGSQARLHVLLVSAGILVYAFADTAYAYRSAADDYLSGSIIDLGWAVGYGLFTLAALAPGASRDPETDAGSNADQGSGLSSLAVYIPLLLSVVAATWRPSSVMDPVMLVTGLLILLLFGIHQVLLVGENDRLRLEREAQLVMLGRLASQNERVIQSVVDGVFGVDATGHITFTNTTANVMLGRSTDELLGTLGADLFGCPEDQRAEQRMTTDALTTGAVVRNAHAEMTTAEGTLFPVEYAVGPILEGDDIAGAVVVFRDVSARLAVEKMKDEFVSIVSHDLKTPLTSIRGALGLLAGGMGGKLSENGLRMVSIALDSSKRLTRLIEDILDIERMESGSSLMVTIDSDISGLVSIAFDEVEQLASEHGVRLVCQPVSGTVRGDPDRMLRILTNLIGNAIKFSPRGGSVIVSTSVVDFMVEFSVTDVGRGIPEEKLLTIFERFEQVDTSDSRVRGGSGLGLTISRDIVRMHGGQIWVDSLVGVGSTFHFTLPKGGYQSQQDQIETA